MIRLLKNHHQYINHSKTSAQVLLEHVLLIGIAVLALVSMSPIIRRTIQSVVKVTADEIGVQKESDQDFNSDRGYLVGSKTATEYSRTKHLRDIPGSVVRRTTEEIDTTTNTITNLGFTQEN